SRRRRHTRFSRDWSSDVCSSDLNVLIPGVGGSGVTTLGALLGMAAHLEGKGCTVLDQAGLAQKFGPVVTHVRIAAKQDDIYAVQIGRASCRERMYSAVVGVSDEK